MNRIKIKIYTTTPLLALLFSWNTSTIEPEEMYKNNPLKKQVLYAPERDTQYANKAIDKKPKKKNNTCIFCKLANNSEKNDEKNLLITRFRYHNLFMNLYPYNKGHLLLIPKKHVKSLSDLSHEGQVELILILSAIPDILEETLGAEDTNIGINLGKIAGASKPDHLHIQIVPRYEFEGIAFISVACDTRVIGYDMKKLYKQLKKVFDAFKDSLYGK